MAGLCLVAVVGVYFANNPLGHGRWFLFCRFINWFPLGMTYAFLYMGRYNLVVSKNALGSLMPKESFGIIFGVGTAVYALSFLTNGPLVDKMGGKRGIIAAAIGSSFANIALGILTYLVVMRRLAVNLVFAYSALYAVNMFFQSFGAVSIIKVKAYWFHVRERGVFGAIFGTLISFGVYFALDWGQAVINLTKAGAGGSGWLGSLLRGLFATSTRTTDATWAVFYVPAVILVFWSILDLLLIKDTPEEAGFPPFDTHDDSSGQMDVKLSTGQLLGKVFGSPLMLLFAGVALTAGVLRNGIIQWYLIFAGEVKQTGAQFFVDHWGFLLCIFGVVGGFAGGLISDKVYQSRRGPPAVLLCGLMFVLAIVMAALLFSAPVLVACAALLIVMAVTGVHSLMSGTAAPDFGGRKATATCSGLVDGCVYLGSGLQSVSIGFLAGVSWVWWPVFLAPFALIGLFVALRFWHDLPPATRKFNADMELKRMTDLSAPREAAKG